MFNVLISFSKALGAYLQIWYQIQHSLHNSFQLYVMADHNMVSCQNVLVFFSFASWWKTILDLFSANCSLWFLDWGQQYWLQAFHEKP